MNGVGEVGVEKLDPELFWERLALISKKEVRAIITKLKKEGGEYLQKNLWDLRDVSGITVSGSTISNLLEEMERAKLVKRAPAKNARGKTVQLLDMSIFDLISPLIPDPTDLKSMNTSYILQICKLEGVLVKERE
jgi:hypothetical protein